MDIVTPCHHPRDPDRRRICASGCPAQKQGGVGFWIEEFLIEKRMSDVTDDVPTTNAVLVNAVTEGDIEAVKNAIADGVDVNYRYQSDEGSGEC